MLFGPIRAVVVDDNPVHLLTISNGLSAAGIPCSSHWFDREQEELVPLPPSDGYKHLRIIFLDLNLRAATNPDASTLFYSAQDILCRLIGKSSAPYALVFWTDVSSKVDEVEHYFHDPERLTDISPPLHVYKVDKSGFLPTSAEGGDFQSMIGSLYQNIAEKTEALKEEVERIANQSALLKTLVSWESRASVAAADGINSITGHAIDDAVDIASIDLSITNVLGEIAYQAVGGSIARENPARALDAGMIEILFDQFSASVDDGKYVDHVAQALAESVAVNKRPFVNQQKMASSLNTYFHIDENNSVSTTSRGVVLKADNLIDLAELGTSKEELIKCEFLHEPYVVLRDFKLKGEEKATKKAEIKEALGSLLRESNLVLVEVGADCDHAQAHPRTYRYLVGLEIPSRDEYKNLYINKNGQLRRPALQLLGPWQIGEEAVSLLISCRRYWTWQQDTIPDAVVKYRLRGSLVNKLLHHYTTWSNRPGIIEFRS